MDRKNIAAIYPLLPTQSAYTWAAKNSDVQDPGIVHVSGRLIGPLDRTALQSAWRHLIQRHEMLRASIHARPGKSSMLVVWKEVPTEIEWLEERSSLAAELSLDQAPVHRLRVTQHGDAEHSIDWAVHHAMLDGWSTSLALVDLMRIYREMTGQPTPNLEASRSSAGSYDAYLKWRNNGRLGNAQQFWSRHFDGFSGNPNRLSSNTVSTVAHDGLGQELMVPDEIVQAVLQRSKQWLVTINAIATAAWGLALAQVYGQADVAFATVSSGRAAPVDRMAELIGCFANVIPTRIALEPRLLTSAWVQQLHAESFNARQFEDTPLEDIRSWCPVGRGRNLAESLFIVENFPPPEAMGELRLTDFQSGLVTAFPVSVVLIPQRAWQAKCVAPELPAEFATQLLELFVQCLAALVQEDRTVGSLCEQLPPWTAPEGRAAIPAEKRALVESRNVDQARLVTIWESILGVQPIGIEDPFFDLGGTSLTAARLVERVEEEFGIRLSPAEFYEHGTVRAMADRLAASNRALSDLIRFNVRSTDDVSDVIVCPHAGEQHPYFFRFLARRLPDVSVVGLYPSDLESTLRLPFYPELAGRYVRELSKSFSNSRIHLLGYCSGAPVSLEMAHQMRERLDFAGVPHNRGLRCALSQPLGEFFGAKS